MARRFDIAVVGCGGVAAMHLEGCARHPERVRLVAACEPDAGRREAARARWRIPSVFPSLEDMIEGARWEVALVCTPTPVRETVVSVLAAAGKHALVEKPLADSLAEAERIVAACEAAGVLLAVDQNFRFHYPFDRARALVRDGRLGRVLGLLHQDMFFRRDRGWRTEQPRHALAVMGIHWLDGFRWALASEARSLLCRLHSSPAVACAGETDAYLQLAFENGASVAYIQSFSSPLATTETRILGERGLLLLDYRGAALYEHASREAAHRWPNPYGGPDKPESAFACLELLLNAIETGAAPPNSGRDNLKTVALLDAAYRSAAEGRVVEFEGGLPR